MLSSTFGDLNSLDLNGMNSIERRSEIGCRRMDFGNGGIRKKEGAIWQNTT